MKKQIKNLKQFRKFKTRVKFQFYVVFRPVAQKWFFVPFLILVIFLGIKDWYANRGEWSFENPTVTTAEALTVRSEVIETSSVSNSYTDPAVVIGGDIVEKIRKVFSEDPDTAVAIAQCESSLDPERIGDTHMKFPSVGLFQVNQTWHKYDTATLQDPDQNIRIAKEIKDRWGNWNAWSCYKQGYYKKFI